jgi:hypothetical protein
MEAHDAFISYNHLHDHNLAKALQEGMQKLAKPLLALRAIDVFRDETSLAANPDLWAGIVDHLTGAKWLVLFACPEWAASYWCSREALWWMDNHSADRVLIVLSGGELLWDRMRGDFDWSVTTALSKDLSGRFHEEPLYVDLRWARGQDGLTLRNLQFRNAVLDLSATIRGVPKDKLDGDDVRQLRKTRWLARGGATAISILAVVASVMAYIATQQRNEAVRQRDLAVGRQLHTEAQRLKAVDSQWTRAVLLAIEAFRRAEDANGYELLWELIAKGAKPVGRHEGTPLVNLSEFGEPRRVAISADGEIIAGVFNQNTVLVFAAGSDHPRAMAQLSDCIIRDLSLSADGGRLAVGCQGDQARIMDQARITGTQAGNVIGKVRYVLSHPPTPYDPSRPPSVAISPDGKMILCRSPKGASVCEAEGQGRVVRVIGGSGFEAVAFDPSARHVAVAGGGGAEVFETFGDQVPKHFGDDEVIECVGFSPEGKRGDDLLIGSVAFSPDGKRVALGVRNRFVNVYDVGTGRCVVALDHKEEETEDLQVRSIVFSSDGQMLASTAINPTRSPRDKRRTLRVFNITGRKESIRVPLAETLRYVGFSPDGAFLDIAVGDKDIRLARLPIHPQDLIADACARVDRNLTSAEWARYLNFFGDMPYRETCMEVNPAAAEIR